MAAALGVLLIGVVIVYVTTNRGRIKIVVDDPKAVVKVDALDVRIEALAEPIGLRAGEHALQVKWGDGTFQTRSICRPPRGKREPACRIRAGPQSQRHSEPGEGPRGGSEARSRNGFDGSAEADLPTRSG